jgi:glycosyltransferase involved in cell wall biosynthesis
LQKLVRITTVPISLKVLLRRQLQFMSSHFDLLAVSSPGQALAEVKEAEGVRVAEVEMTRAITPFKDLNSLLRLYRLLKREKPAIVHTHTPKAGLIGMLAARFAGVPVRMHTVAGMPLLESRGMKRKLLEYVEALTYRNATMVYPNSGNLAQIIIKNRYCSDHKIKVIGNGSSNGIDTSFFQPDPELLKTSAGLKNKLNIPDSAFVFLFVGRMVKDKGLNELVEAFERLKKEHSTIRLLLVGPYEQDLDPLLPGTMDKIKTDPDIIQVDFQQDVRPYYLMSDVLVFPSYREGFPNVPMQAGCMNLPSIVTNINGCNEIVEEEKNGLIIPVKDTDALASAMNRLYTDKQLYATLKRNARRMIVERYEQRHIWELLLKEYHEQLKKHHRVS